MEAAQKLTFQFDTNFNFVSSTKHTNDSILFTLYYQGNQLSSSPLDLLVILFVLLFLQTHFIATNFFLTFIESTIKRMPSFFRMLIGLMLQPSSSFLLHLPIPQTIQLDPTPCFPSSIEYIFTIHALVLVNKYHSTF